VGAGIGGVACWAPPAGGVPVAPPVCMCCMNMAADMVEGSAAIRPPSSPSAAGREGERAGHGGDTSGAGTEAGELREGPRGQAGEQGRWIQPPAVAGRMHMGWRLGGGRPMQLTQPSCLHPPASQHRAAPPTHPHRSRAPPRGGRHTPAACGAPTRARSWCWSGQRWPPPPRPATRPAASGRPWTPHGSAAAPARRHRRLHLR